MGDHCDGAGSGDGSGKTWSRRSEESSLADFVPYGTDGEETGSQKIWTWKAIVVAFWSLLMCTDLCAQISPGFVGPLSRAVSPKMRQFCDISSFLAEREYMPLPTAFPDICHVL